jgi:exodeoxyribonuclease V alpha subunit
VLDVVLERITYANEETGYTIARVATGRSGTDLLTVVGSLLGVQPGESLRLVGRWGSHPRYGRQFEVHSFSTVLPATVQGIERYLGSGLIKGIGPKMAGRIVEHFGADTLQVIEEAPGRLVEVPGLGPKRTAMIGTAWEEQQAIKEVMVFLQGVGVSTSLAVRIYKKYGDASISIVRNEPYRLAADVWGIGFKTADTIAQAVGIPPDSPCGRSSDADTRSSDHLTQPPCQAHGLHSSTGTPPLRPAMLIVPGWRGRPGRTGAGR